MLPVFFCLVVEGRGAVCNQSLSCCCDQIADHSNLKKKGFILAYSLRMHSGRAERIHSGGEGQAREAAGYTVSVGGREATGGWLHYVSRKEGTHWCSDTFCFVVQAMGRCCPHSWWVFFPLLTAPPPKVPSQRDPQCIFFMIRNPGKLTR